MKKLLTVLLVFILFGCLAQKPTSEKYESDQLKITLLTGSIFVHESYLHVQGYGIVPCNGMIFKNNNKAIVFDTPVTDTAALELIYWITNELNCEIMAVVVNHFHNDCLATLNQFHDRGIKSYANNRTIVFARNEGSDVPQIGFDGVLEIDLDGKKVFNEFFGEGHTRDNIVSYIPDQNVLFGGCLVKEMNAGKGNLADANLDEWSNTIRKVKTRYPKVQYVVPGHGKSGGIELLNYTMELFKKD